MEKTLQELILKKKKLPNQKESLNDLREISKKRKMLKKEIFKSKNPRTVETKETFIKTGKIIGGFLKKSSKNFGSGLSRITKEERKKTKKKSKRKR